MDLTNTGSHQTASPSSRPRTPSAGVLVAVGLLLVALNLRIGVASIGPILTTLERDLGVSPTAASLLTTVPVFAFGAFAFVTPVATARIGLHRLLGVTTLAIAAGIALRSAPSLWALYGGTVLLGAAIAVGNVLMPAAIKQDFSHRVGLMTGAYSTALFVGAAAASALTVPLASVLGGSWRAGLSVWALPALLALVVWLPRALQNPGHVPGAHRVADAPADLRAPELSRLLRDGTAWSVTAFMGLQSLTYYAALTWVPSVLQDAGASDHSAGLLLSFSAFPGIVGALLTPGLAHRLRPWSLVAAASVLTFAGVAGLLVAPITASWLWMTLLGLGQGSAISLVLSFIVWRSPDARHTSQLSTMAQGVGYLVAGLGPLGLGVLHAASGGWSVPLTALLVLLIVQGLAGAAASRPRHVLQQ